jgi:leader peptidase (prepilin peptidase) / N-methyltransferase
MVVLFLLILGAVIGSFLNVVIYRLPRNESLVFPPSHCPHCRHKLSVIDLIPVVSYILIGGKCRYCHQPISPLYPIVESLTAVLFVTTYLLSIQHGFVYLSYILFILCILIAIFFIDLLKGIIPLYLVIVGSMVTIAYLAYAFSLTAILTHVLSGLLAFGFFFFLFAITKGRGMGFGDVMLVFLLGLILGFPNIAIALYISFLSGAVFSLILIAIGSKRIRHDTIPFGPFLVLGTLVSLFWGNQIVEIVLQYLLRS